MAAIALPFATAREARAERRADGDQRKALQLFLCGIIT